MNAEWNDKQFNFFCDACKNEIFSISFFVSIFKKPCKDDRECDSLERRKGLKVFLNNLESFLEVFVRIYCSIMLEAPSGVFIHVRVGGLLSMFAENLRQMMYLFCRQYLHFDILTS